MDPSPGADAPSRERTHEVLADLGRAVLETDDLDAVLSDAATAVADALETEYACVLECRPGAGEAAVRVADDWPDGAPPATVDADPETQVGTALRSNEPVAVADRDDARVDVPGPLADAGVASGICAVVGPSDRPWGVLGAFATDPRAFDRREVAFVRGVANLLGSAVETDRAGSGRVAFDARRAGGFLAVDEDRQITFCDERAAEVVDAVAADREEPAPTDLVGTDVADAFAGADDAAVRDAVERAASTGEAATAELRASDTDEWYELAASPAETGLSVSVRDVTDARRAAERLEQERDMFADGPAVVFRWEADESEGWPVEYVSENVADVLGYEPAELESGAVPYADLLLDEEMDRIAREVAEDSDGTTDRFSHEPYRIKTKDAGVRWVKDTTKIVRDESGEITHYLGYLVDITERKERERALEERERQLSALMANVPGMVYRCRNERGWPMEFVSDAAADLTGYDPEAIERDEVNWGADVMVEADRESVWESVQRAAERGETFSETYRIETADGESRWVRDYGRGVTDDDGEPRLVEGIIEDVTDRVNRERELEQYETIVEAVNDGVYVVDDTGRFTMVNTAYAEMLGYDREDLIGEHVSLVVDKQVAERAQEAESAMREGETDIAVIEAEMETAGGDRLPAEATFAMLPTGDDRERRVGVVRDVSARKERERELRRTERRFEAIFEDPNILVGLLEPDGTVLDINETAMEYVDADLAGVRGEPFWETPWWGEGDGVEDDVREWTERAVTGEYVDFQADLTRPDGEEYTLEGFFRPVTDDDGDVVSIVVSDRDVTERRRRERELEESRRRYRALAEYFPNGIVTLFDRDLRYELAAGRGFEKIAVDPMDLEGRRVTEPWDAETAGALEPIFRGALDGEERSVEVEYEGREWIVRAVSITDERGDVFGGMTMAQDITERKERERKLEQSNERLEQFAYAASHDLQEPLRMVSSYLQLIERRYADELDDDGREFIDYAVDGADRMRDMVDGLLQYSRVDTGGDPFEAVELNDVLDDVLEDLSVRIREADADVTVDDLPAIEGDGSQLRQLFQNLLDNAVEYSGDGPPQVRISAERRDARATPDRSRTSAETDGNGWVISVSDEGIGIDPDDADRVFEVFQRLHAVDDHEGTGIGLALCERIVERHGGEIWVDSEPGEGATFSFTLPAAD